MKIIFAARGLYPFEQGGAQRHSYCLICELAKLKIHIHVIHPHSQRAFAGIDRVTEYPVGSRGTRYRHLLSFSTVVSRIINDISHDYDFVYGDGVSLLRYLPNNSKPCLFDPRGMPVLQKGFVGGFRDIVSRRHLLHCIRNSPYVRSLGGKLTNILKNAGVSDDRIVELPNGIYLNEIKKKKTRRCKHTCLFVGTLNGNKGIPDLIRIINKLRGTEIRFVLAGSGPMEKLVRKQQFPNVTLLGHIKDREKLSVHYCRAEAFVLPSRQDGMPQVVWEAMAHGLPIIATDVGAVSAMVDEGINGFVSPRGDVEGFAANIKRVFRLSQTDRNKMEKAAEKKVSNFAWPVVAERFRRKVEYLISLS